MPISPPHCLFVARVVPDGRSGDDLRVSLCLLPRAGADPQAGPIALDRWPTEIAALFKDGVSLRLRQRGATAVSTITARVTGAGSPSGLAVWQKVLGGADGPSWPDLWTALRADQDAEALTPANEYDRSHVLSYPIDAPLAFLEKSFAAPGAGALAMLNADVTKRKVDTLAPSRMLVPSLHDEFLDLFTNAASPAAPLTEEPSRAGESEGPPPIPKAVLLQLGRRRADRPEDGKADNALEPSSPIGAHWQTALAAALDGWKRSQATFAANTAILIDNDRAGEAADLPAADPREGRTARLAGLDARLEQLFARAATAAERPDATIDFGSGSARSETTDIFREAFALYHLSTRRDLDHSHGLAEDEEMMPPAIARRKLAAIVGQPVLARALGFTVDLTIKRADLPAGDAFFELALGTEMAGVERELWSATKITDTFFGPVPAAEYLKKADPITGQVPRATNGLVDLAQTTRVGPRYKVAQIDVPLGLESWENAGRSRQNQSLQGDAAEVSARTPALLGGVLELCDSHAGHAVLADIVSSDPKRSVLFEEDLRAGFRMDVGIAPRQGVTIPPERWRSLTEAEVRFDDLGIQAVRSDGWFEPIARLVDTEADKPKQVVANPVIARWGGDSHALSARASAEAELQDAVPQQSDARKQISWLSPDTDVALKATFSYPTKPDPVWGEPLRLPPARYGRAYTVGIRTALINGGGVPLAAATRGYANDGMVPPDGPVQLRRFAEIQSPIVLVPDKDDALADAASLDALAGEQVTSMLLREGEAGQTVRRFLAVPRVPLETVVSHGMLDRTGGNVPRGAYETYKLDRESGEFATLPPLKGRNAVSENETRGSRGAVLKEGPSKPAQPWYPDPLAERCCLVFRRNGQIPLGFGQGPKLDPAPLIIEINRRAQWPNAKPLEIELRPISGDVAVRGRMTSVGTASAPKVRVELARGESVDLVAWMIPSDPWALEEHAFFDRVPALASSIGRSQSDRTFASAASAIQAAMTAGANAGTLDTDKWNALFSRAPLPGLSTPVAISITHAVKKPLLQPKFKPVTDGTRGELALVRPEPTSEQPAQAWARSVAGQQTPDLLAKNSGRNGHRAFVVGSVMIDRAATRRLDLQMRWREHGAVALSKSDTDWVYEPKQRDWLTVGHIDLTWFEAGGTAERVDLTFERDTAPRALNYDFGDTIARKVDVRVVALSRYAAFFEGQQPAKGGNGDDYTRVSDVETLWVPATSRPPVASLKKFEKVPFASFVTTGVPGNYEVTRSPLIELRFADIDVSGEDELIGIVCPTADQQDIGKLDSATGFGRFLSRQGHDPMFESGHVEPWLADRYFPGATVRELNMPYIAPGDAPNDPPKTAPVQVFGLRPAFDRKHGDWVLRLALDSGQSYAPFVRLGLTRWQPHAIAGEELSLPVPSLHRVHPNRVVSATFTGSDRLLVKVRGQAYRRTATPPGTMGDQWHRSAIELRLQYLNGNEWVSEIDPRTGGPVVLETASKPSGAEAEWLFDVTLPRPHTKRHYAVWLEEYGWIVGDGEDEESTVPVKFEQHFQCKIDMRSGLAE